MRRLFAFLLGILFGVILVVGAVVGGVYYAYTNVTPEQISPDTNKFLGDFSKLSTQEIIAKFQEIYGTKVNQGSDLYTIGEFMTDYNIDAKTAFGMELPQEVLDIPLFEMTTGEEGFNKAMQAMKVSTIPAIVNMFGATDENGNLTGMFGEEVMAVLAEHNMAELTAEGGLATVLEGIKLVWLLPDAFPSEDTENKLMYAVGQSDLGKLLGSVSGNENLFAQLGEDGGLAAVGQLSIMDIAGTSGGGSQMLELLLGDARVVDLIDENGNLNPDSVINGLQIGALLGLKRLAVEDTAGYSAIFENIQQNGDSYIMLDKETWYQAHLSCTKEIGIDHTAHTADCYSYSWYEACSCAEHHHVVIDGANYKLAQGLYKVLASLSIEDLTSGDQNALMEKITSLTIRDLMAGQEISGIIEAFADMTIAELMDGGIDSIVIGQLLGMKRYEVTEIVEPLISALTPEQMQMLLAMDGDSITSTYVANNGSQIAMSEDGEIWYWAQLVCSNGGCSHTHTNGHPNLACYNYKWYTQCTNLTHTSCDHHEEAHPTEADYFLAKGLMSLIADYSIGDLDNLQSVINKIKLGDVLEVEGTMLESFADTPIGQLAGEVQSLRLGYALSYTRTEADATGYTAVAGLTSVMQKDGSYIRKLDGEDVWYKASLVCTTAHEHEASCYSIWQKEDSSYATGIEGKLADEQIADMGDIANIINDLTLADVMGSNVPSMLSSIANTKIGELDTAIDGLYLASFLDYQRKEIADISAYTLVAGLSDVMQNGDSYVRMEASDGKWYQAKLYCSTDHTHTVDCYGYVWYKGADEVTGITAKLGGKTVSQLQNLEDIINNDITLRDVMGESIPDMLVSIADTPVGQLGDAINTLYVGDAMSYHRVEVEDTTGYGAAAIIYDGSEIKYYLRDNGVDIILSADNTVWYKGVMHCDDPAHAHTHTCYGYLWLDKTDVEASGIIAKLANERINELGSIQDTINDFKLGDVITIDSTSPHALQSLADVQIGQLGDKFGTLTVADVIDIEDENTNKIFVELKDVEINNLGAEINNVHIGSALGYELRCELEHTHTKECWFRLVCVVDHTHTDACYTTAEGITGAIVDMTIEQLSQPDTLKQRINGLTLGEIIEIDGSNKLLAELGDTKIENLSTALDEMRLGVALGYSKKAVSAADYPYDIIDNGTVYVKATSTTLETAQFAMSDNGYNGNYYLAKFDCNDDAHTLASHHTVDCFGYVWYNGETIDSNEVKGINDKLASLTINRLGGDDLTNIITSLTIGELMESGMMSLGDTIAEIAENEAKFDIIFHDTTTHDEQINVGTSLLPINVQCNLAGYFAYLTQNPSGTAVEFYNMFSHTDDPQWKELKLSEFIETLLNTL